MTSDTLVLTATDVARALDIRACIDAVARTLCAHEAGATRGPASSGLTLRDGSVHAKLAAVETNGRTYVAVKTNINLPGNPVRHARPTIQGALLLFDGDTGQPLLVMDSIVVTSVRTAAVAALAARHLSLAASHTITIVGCGAQGEAQLEAMCAVRELRTAFAVDTDRDKATDFAHRMSVAHAIDVQPTTDLASAIRASDICVTCTTSQAPFLYREHLHPGLFVAAVGADNPAKQEIDAGAMANSRVVVDSLTACAAGGDLHHAIAAKTMSEAGVYAELSAIVAGRIAGRRDPDEVFIFDSTGTALQDVAAAVVVYERALADEAGARVIFDDRPHAVARG
ncbi:MAG TPA: ornithine cyclodeaminase family protein [Vicinamibacterales bacterium]|nr:ornithine cyclodeaminase family protein [Vicinamibacterales bacterium]